MMDIKKTYQFADNVFASFAKDRAEVSIIKLDDEDYYYKASLVVCQILKLIDGKKTYSEIIDEVCSMYRSEHEGEIRKESLKLLEKLIEEKILR